MSIIEKAIDKLGPTPKELKAEDDLDVIAEAGQIPLAEPETALEEHQQVQPQPEIEVTLDEPLADEKLVTESVEQNATVPPQPTVVAGAGEMIEIPFDHLSELGMITPLTPRSGIAEEYRAIKRPLLTNIAGKGAAQIDNANLIMVTSALQGDGKTFSAINLALSIAMEQDKTVLFVDADVSKATAGGILGIGKERAGLIDLLENKGVGVSDVMLKTNIQNLRILPAGNVHERATELLASQSMANLMKELSERYVDRVIVFDSPPLLLTSEAGVLTNLMGQVVFVVAADKTPASAVKEAIEHIGTDKMIGTILNKARSYRVGKHGYAYAYGYGYGYGYGSERYKKKSED